MKKIIALSLLALAVAGTAHAQSQDVTLNPSAQPAASIPPLDWRGASSGVATTVQSNFFGAEMNATTAQSVGLTLQVYDSATVPADGPLSGSVTIMACWPLVAGQRAATYSAGLYPKHASSGISWAVSLGESCTTKTATAVQWVSVLAK